MTATPPPGSTPDPRRATDAVQDHPEGATVRLRVVPRVRRSEVVGQHADAYKLKVAAPPVDGAANDEVRRFLADRVGVRRTDVEILTGAKGRDKVVLVRGVRPDHLRRAFGD